VQKSVFSHYTREKHNFRHQANILKIFVKQINYFIPETPCKVYGTLENHGTSNPYWRHLAAAAETSDPLNVVGPSVRDAAARCRQGQGLGYTWISDSHYSIIK